MADKTTITVKDVKTVTKQNINGGQYTQTTIIGDDGKSYNGLNIELPEIGSTLEITYQDVRGFNSIISLKEVTTMATKKQTTTATTSETTAPASVTFKGTLYYAYIKEPEKKIGNKKYASGKYLAEIAISDNTAQQLEGFGIDVKNVGDEKGNFVRARSSTQPVVQDENGNRLDNIPLIGNGTTAKVTCGIYKNGASQGGENCLGLNTIKILELVEFNNTLELDE